MTDAKSSNTEEKSPGRHAEGMAAAALVLSAEVAEISAEAEERDRSGSVPPLNPAVSGARPRVRSEFVPRRRAAARRPPTMSRTEPGSVTAPPATLDHAPDPGAESRPDTKSELREWIKDNATLLSNASLLISLATLALSLLPDVGFFSPYIKALLFAAALLLLIELHHQWPEDLQLHLLRRNGRPERHSWRMIGFAFLMQIATLVFAIWATLTNPIILLPLTALGIFFAFYRWYFSRHSGILARIVGIIALVAVLLISELLMVIIWAAVTGEQVTIQLWTEEGTGVNFDQ